MASKIMHGFALMYNEVKPSKINAHTNLQDDVMVQNHFSYYRICFSKSFVKVVQDQIQRYIS